MPLKDQLYLYNVADYEVIDGDTVRVLIDLGFGTYLGKESNKRTWYSVRIVGIDTPEKRGAQHRAAGKAVTKVVKNLLGMLSGTGQPLYVKSIKRDKFGGRVVGDIRWDGSDDKGVVSLSEWLMANKLAKVYDGGRKQIWSDDELTEVEAQSERLLEELNGDPDV